MHLIIYVLLTIFKNVLTHIVHKLYKKKKKQINFGKLKGFLIAIALENITKDRRLKTHLPIRSPLSAVFIVPSMLI